MIPSGRVYILPHTCCAGTPFSTWLLECQTGEETFFKIKKTTKMQKVFETYATRKGVQVNSLRFLLDGDRITPDQTPKMLELEDQDQIDCVLEQTGGKGHGQIGAAAQ